MSLTLTPGGELLVYILKPPVLPKGVRYMVDNNSSLLITIWALREILIESVSLALTVMPCYSLSIILVGSSFLELPMTSRWKGYRGINLMDGINSISVEVKKMSLFFLM